MRIAHLLNHQCPECLGIHFRPDCSQDQLLNWILLEATTTLAQGGVAFKDSKPKLIISDVECLPLANKQPNKKSSDSRLRVQNEIESNEKFKKERLPWWKKLFGITLQVKRTPVIPLSELGPLTHKRLKEMKKELNSQPRATPGSKAIYIQSTLFSTAELIIICSRSTHYFKREGLKPIIDIAINLEDYEKKDAKENLSMLPADYEGCRKRLDILWQMYGVALKYLKRELAEKHTLKIRRGSLGEWLAWVNIVKQYPEIK